MALMLSVVFGWLGIDRFYLGRTSVGLLKLFTLGGFGILWIVDIIMIATKSVRGIVWSERDPSKSWLKEYWPLIIAGIFTVYFIAIWVVHFM